MINSAINSMIEKGHPLYKVSAEKKTCKVAILSRKVGKHCGYMWVAKFQDGHDECVRHLNGIEDDKNQEPGWYVMI